MLTLAGRHYLGPGVKRWRTSILPKIIQPGTLGQKGIMKKSWWKLIITDYPNYDPNDVDLEHIAEQIKQGMHQGELIQEEEKSLSPGPKSSDKK